MKFKLLFLLLILNSSYQLDCMNRKVSFTVGIGATVLGVGSLAWQIYSKDYSLKKSLVTGTLFVTGIGSFLWSCKKQVKSQIKPFGKIPILYKQIKEIDDNKDYNKLQQLIHSYNYEEVNKAFNHHLFTLVMNWYKDGMISAQQFYGLGLNNLGWHKIITAYRYGYLHIGHMKEILMQIKTHEEINNLSIPESLDYDSDNYTIDFVGDIITPLHCAVQSDRMLPLIQLLIEYGADIYTCSKNGQSVYGYALNYEAFEAAKYIRQYAKLQIALGFNCRDIVFSGSSTRRLCIERIRSLHQDIESTNPQQLEMVGTQLMERRMNNGPNVCKLPIEIIDHIADFALS